jgi:hypothetical protein
MNTEESKEQNPGQLLAGDEKVENTTGKRIFHFVPCILVLLLVLHAAVPMGCPTRSRGKPEKLALYSRSRFFLCWSQPVGRYISHRPNPEREISLLR